VTVAKAIVQLLAAVLAAILPQLVNGPLDTAAWVNVVIVGCGAIAVWNAANIPGFAWAKMIASAVATLATVLATALAAGHALDMTDYVQMGLAFLGTIAVAAIPNSPSTTAA